MGLITTFSMEIIAVTEIVIVAEKARQTEELNSIQTRSHRPITINTKKCVNILQAATTPSHRQQQSTD